MEASQAAGRVLIVEDEQPIAEVLAELLESEGYPAAVCGDGPGALAEAFADPPALVLLDVMLPGIDGIEVCRRLRAESTVPIIMLTAKVEEIDRVVGLEVGADDYVTKPFGMRELIARVRAALRRAQMQPDEDAAATQPAHFGAITVDPARREVRRDGQVVALKPKEFDLLLHFARNPGRVFTREQLLERVWGYDFAGTNRTVDVHIRWLREKIEDDPAHPRYLRTSRGTGYLFEGSARE